MKSSDRAVLIGVGVVVVIAVFWLMILAPKRHEASDLSSQIDDLKAQVTQNEQQSSVADQARTSFAHDYRRLVAIGKAVPADADTPSLLTELQTLSNRSRIGFRSIELSGDSGVTSTPAVAPTPSTDPTAASEAAAALLPIGATVGPANLPVMPYSLQFQGGFFDVAKFFGKLDSTVYTDKSDQIRVDGRLLTIDGFSLAAAPDGFPDLQASVAVTSYLAPKDGGITAGATPAGPVTTPTETASTDTTTTPTTPAPTAAIGAN